MSTNERIVVGGIALIVFGVALLIGQECLSPGGTPKAITPATETERLADFARSLPPGSTVRSSVTETTKAGQSHTVESAKGVGAGLSTNSDEAAAHMTSTAPQVSLSGIGTASGGDSSYDVKVFGRSLNMLQILGALMIVGAILELVLVKSVKIAAAMAAAGFAMIGLGSFLQLPPLAVVLVVVAAFAVLVWMRLHGGVAAANATDALTSHISALQGVGDEARDQVAKAAAGASALKPGIASAIRKVEGRLGIR